MIIKLVPWLGSDGKAFQKLGAAAWNARSPGTNQFVEVTSNISHGSRMSCQSWSMWVGEFWVCRTVTRLLDRNVQVCYLRCCLCFCRLQKRSSSAARNGSSPVSKKRRSQSKPSAAVLPACNGSTATGNNSSVAMAAVVNTRQRRLSSAVSNSVTLGKYNILMVTNVSKNFDALSPLLSWQ